MAAAARHYTINQYGAQYPDDDSVKRLVLQAEGLTSDLSQDRHVVICWTNAVGQDGTLYTQLIHLTGGPGNYGFHTPQVKSYNSLSLGNNTFYSLGDYTRARRNQVVALAKAIKFNKRSRVNSCRTWMRYLLEAMVDAGLLSKEKFDEIDNGVPLKRPVPEE
jgi:hypothetical protein